MTGILPWLRFHSVAVMMSLLLAVSIALVGIFTGGRIGRSGGDSEPAKRATFVGIGVAVCVACFALGYLSTGRQREVDEQTHYRARVAIRLDAYRTVTTTSWMDARKKFGDDLLQETRHYQERFGIEKGTNRVARMLSEAVIIAEAIERETENTMLTNASGGVGEQIIDPVTGLPAAHAARDDE